MICETQSAVVEFLSSPKNFGGAPIQRVDTHLSHVFLVGARVYKIKRAVRYEFVNFSKLATRKKACEKEVSINRRTAPKMYLGVVPIYCDENGVSWEGDDEPVEWAVEMARFDSNLQFDVMLSYDKIDNDTINKLGEKIASFHLHAEEKKSCHPQNNFSLIVDQLSTALHSNEMGSTRAEDVTRWARLASAECEKHISFLDARRRHGWVRHCHGDLHLANICMFEGEPTPFDAIEFNDDLADIDVLYDLAFVLMDFVRHNRGDLANLLLNRYLSATRDYAGLRVMRLFLSTRAAVRAMVLSFPVQSEKSKLQAERYLDLALEFLIGENHPHLIAVGGYSGTGKSTIARAIAKKVNGRCGAVVLNSDIIRKRLDRKAPEEHLSEERYTRENTDRVYGKMFKDARRALRAGQTVIVDATFSNAQFRRQVETLAKSLGIPFLGFWLSAPEETLRTRIEDRPDGVSDATLAVLEKQLQQGEEPQDWRIINASGTLQETLSEVRARLEVIEA